MANVRTLQAANNLENIPHMLRNMASEIEAGETASPRTVFVVVITDGNAPPELYQFGQEVSRLEEIGALTACANMAMQVEATP